MAIVGGRRKGEGTYYLRDTECKFCEKKRVLWMDGSDGCTT